MSETPADSRIHQVERLDRATVGAVAARVAEAVSFEDLIYRESELDALWSLADIAAGSEAREPWVRLRELLGRAHDHVPEGEVADAARVLREVCALLPE